LKKKNGIIKPLYVTAVLALLTILIMSATSIEGHASTNSNVSEKIVFGFWPEYVDNTNQYGYYYNYQPDWNSLTHMAYSHLTVSASGTVSTDYLSTVYNSERTIATQHGVKNILLIMSGETSYNCFYGSLYTHRATTIANLVAAMQNAKADGLCLDYEGFGYPAVNQNGAVDYGPIITQFLHDLRASMKAVNPNSELSFCTYYGVDGGYRTTGYSTYIDYAILMEYDYNHLGTDPGSVTPPAASLVPYINDFNNFVPLNKTVVGLPLYGYKWPCTSSAKGATRTSDGSPLFMLNSNLAESGHTINRDSTNLGTPWFSYYSNGQWYQGWYDDEISLANKMDYILAQKNIRGIGYWANGFEDSDSDILAITKQKLNPTSTTDNPPSLNSLVNKTINEGQTLSFSVSASDTDGDKVTYSVVGSPIGAALNTTSGLFSWTPGYNASGTYTLKFIATSNELNDSEFCTISVIDSITTSTNTNKTIVFAPLYDNRLRKDSSNSVLATDAYLDVGQKSSISRDVMYFDLSKYTTTSKITKATLSLCWYYPTATTRKYDTIVEIYRPVAWNAKYVSWNNRAARTPWITSGGRWLDKNCIGMGTTPYASLTFSASQVPTNNYYNFDVTKLVQEYVSGKYTNTGFFIKARTENNNYIAFYSKEWTNSTQTPKLTIISQ
jgi:hypothetical protein